MIKSIRTGDDISGQTCGKWCTLARRSGDETQRKRYATVT